LAKKIEIPVSAPKIRNPTIKGSTVPSYCIPMKVPKGTEIKVDTEPTIAAPIPAICPRGSIAIAFRFPKSIPIKKTVDNKYAIKIVREGTGIMVFVKMKKVTDIVSIANEAVLTISFIP
jgi:hypothetical protein